MRKVITLILTIIVCLAWADVSVKKILETKSIKKYNQWIDQHKDECPVLKPKLVIIKQTKALPKIQSYEEIQQIERTLYPSENNPYIKKYEIIYYDNLGNYRYTQTINGYVDIWQYKDSEYLAVIRHDHPIYPSKSIMKIQNNLGNTIIAPENEIPYGFPVGENLFVEYPFSISGGSGKNPSVRIFSADGYLLNTLKETWTIDNAIISQDSQYIAMYALETDSYFDRTLIILSRDAKELWRETIGPPFEICFGNNNDVIIGVEGTVRIYDITGNLKYVRDISESKHISNIHPIINKNQLIVLIDSEMYLVDNTLKQILWNITIPDSSVVRYLLADEDGLYSVVVFNSHNVCIINNTNGSLIKSFKSPLGEKLTCKKEIEESKVAVKQYKAPADNWSCQFLCDYLIFEKAPDDKNKNGYYIIYFIE